MNQISSLYNPEVKFRIDINGQFDLVKAIRFCKSMEQFNIEYIEQPLPKEELEDLSGLRMHTEIPIAVDESLTDYEPYSTAQETFPMPSFQHYEPYEPDYLKKYFLL